MARAALSSTERAGLELFAARCERCHAARLVAGDPASRVPETQWERLVLSEAGPIVWASASYARTGIEPYVHERGARVPSLRRLERKRPYFTNGSAETLDELLERAGFSEAAGEAGFSHDVVASPLALPAERLTPAEREALRSFLLLL